MRKIIVAALALGATALYTAPRAGAQTFLEKVQKFAGKSDSIGVFQERGTEYVIDGPGSITQADGSSRQGTIKFTVTTDKNDMRFFYFTPANEMKPKKMWGDDVAFFTVKNRPFYPIRMKEDDISVGHKTIFMEMMNDSASDKFKMYQFRKLEPNTVTGSPEKPNSIHTGWYVMLPDFKNAHEIVDMTFTPFAKRMSEYLKDCPALAAKIKKKEDGYKVSMFSGAGNDEVFFRIMQEYNHCGQ